MAEATGSAPSSTGAGNAQQNQVGQGTSAAPGAPKKQPQQQGGNPLTQAASEVESDFESPSLGDEIEGGEEYVERDESEDLDDNGKPKKKPEAEEKPDPFSDQAKHKIKIKGQDVEINGTQLKKLAEQGGRMYQAMEEAATYRKQNDEFRGLFDRVRTQPESAIEFVEALGHDFDKMAHEHVLKKMNYANMNDVERKAYDYEQELNKYKARDAKAAEEKQNAEAQERTQYAAQKAKTEVFEYFSQKFDSKQMQQPQNLKVLADTLEVVLGSWDQRSGNRVPVAKAFEIVQNRIKADRQSTLQELSDAELDALPDDHPLIKKIRQRDLQRYKSRQSGRPERTNQNSMQQKPSQPKQPKNVGIDDLFADLEKRFQ